MAYNFSDYCLGMCDWTDCPREKENETSATSREQCFTEFVSDDKLADLAKGFFPDNTEKNTRWALKNFDLWRKARNTCRPEDSVPVNFFQCTDPKLLNRHLSRFVLEMRKSNGERYPPATLHHLLCGLLRHLNSRTRAVPILWTRRFFDFGSFMVLSMPTSISSIRRESVGKCSMLKLSLRVKKTNCGRVA